MQTLSFTRTLGTVEEVEVHLVPGFFWRVLGFKTEKRFFRRQEGVWYNHPGNGRADADMQDFCNAAWERDQSWKRLEETARSISEEMAALPK